MRGRHRLIMRAWGSAAGHLSGGSLDPRKPARERGWPHTGTLHPCDRGPKEKLLLLIQGLFSITYSSKIAWHFCIFHY